MPIFKSPQILGQQVPDLSKTVIVKIIGKNNTPVVKIVPMPGVRGTNGPIGPQGPQGIQGPPGAIENVTFGAGLSYNPSTSTLSIANLDGGVI